MVQHEVQGKSGDKLKQHLDNGYPNCVYLFKIPKGDPQVVEEPLCQF